MTSWRVPFAVACLVWAGMVIGVSFVATPAKFLAPSLSLPVALDVGRHTFAVLARIEWVAVIVLLVPALMSDIRREAVATVLVMAALIAVQVFWLIPDLDRRVAIYQAGQVPPPSSLHAIYVAIELVKVLVLVAGALAAWRLAGRDTGRDSAAR